MLRRKSTGSAARRDARSRFFSRASGDGARRSRSVHNEKNADEDEDENERVARRRPRVPVAVVRHPSRIPDVARVAPERRGRFAFSFPLVEGTAACRARSVARDAGRRRSPPLVVPARTFSPRSVVLFRQASARAIFGFASARARPQRTTRRFRRTSGRRRRSSRRPTEPPAPGASVSARLLAARRFACVRVGSRVGKRAS